MDSFSDELRRNADPIWQMIFNHPFVIEMGEGTLPIEKFKFYIKQDYPFLIEFARCLGIATAKVQDLETMRTFASLLKASLTLEMEMLEKLGSRLGVPVEEMRGTEPTP
ncbi:MAG: thiaminase II, partial [Candidatus Bathyarchaeia archaeon]